MNDYISIAVFPYNNNNNIFNTTIEIIMNSNIQPGCLLAVRNYEGVESKLYDQFYVNVLYNEVIDNTHCKWSDDKLSLLHQWVKINFIDIMKIWDLFMFHYNEDVNMDEIVNQFKNVNE